MVMVVSTAGLTGRGRVESVYSGSHGSGLYGWLNAPEAQPSLGERELALKKEAKRIQNRMNYERRKAENLAKGLTAEGTRRLSMKERGELSNKHLKRKK
jgi:hypothetical protein